ncbi:MAG: hypothetical protein A2289_02005 [Deltaproteobacteria bacterium RIFOXYA12_FULL_58_15]|nr:MAG: hypothetical protein A2289_02005 [Deltaproteobacteria bacterium RIFOXYA12_FULL_58_15]OGR08023.1 MAG: hypothetical protein A2341_04035 [Deltaproteobacteria bacterium RIFOXYB12_FULL_58_9]
MNDGTHRVGRLPVQGVGTELLAEIESLQLNARHAAQGAMAGMHRSLRRGASIEFSEHKVYTPGDDIRHIDWRAYAKTDRYHVKQFEDETNLLVELIVDHSGSMAFATPGLPSKLEVARTLAAAIAYLALRQGDAVGLLTFAGDVTEELPARATSTHLMEVLTRLVRLEPQGPTAVCQSIDQFAQRARRRAVTVILTDLFDPDPDLLGAFRRLAARRHDVAVLHLLDPAERDFPYDNPSLFASMEDDRRLFVHPRTLRSAYVAEMQKFLADTTRRMSEARIDYHLVDTKVDAANILGAFLRGRERRV